MLGSRDLHRLKEIHMAKKNGQAKSMKRVLRPTLGESFADNLRRYRERMDLSQAALGARAGITVSHVSMLERGTRNPSFGVIEHIAAALNVRDPRKMFEMRS
jgi:ribosome-binding protein aMBF1 (putative translation factor)